MASRKSEFGQLKPGDAFLYHDQLYRKESHLSALLVRWATGGEEITERVSHRFYPEIVVDLPDDADGGKSITPIG
jgi:hypothetical protein